MGCRLVDGLERATQRQEDQLEDRHGGILEGGETGLAERLNVGLREEEGGCLNGFGLNN